MYIFSFGSLIIKVIVLALFPREVLNAILGLSEDAIVDEYDIAEFLDYISIKNFDESLLPILSTVENIEIRTMIEKIKKI